VCGFAIPVEASGMKSAAVYPFQAEPRTSKVMAKEKEAPLGLFFRELFQLGIYKRSQGRIARQVTFAVLALGVLLAAWRLSVTAIGWRVALLGDNSEHVLRFGLPGLLAFVGVWISFRLVNIPNFADFLIAVEAEMNKV